MKSLLCKYLLIVTLTTQFIAIPQSKAVVCGFIGESLILALAGVASMGAGTAIAYPASNIVNSNKYNRLSKRKKRIGWTLVAVSSILLFSGFFLLSEKDKTIHFLPIDEQEGFQLGFTSEQMMIFNSEIEEVNAVKNQMAHDLSQIKKPTLEDSMKVWEYLRSNLSLETQDVMAKLSAKLIEKK